MTDPLRFTLPVTPTAQQRPRFFSLGRGARAYKSQTQAENERSLDILLRRYAPCSAYECPVCVSIDAYLPMPARATRADRTRIAMGELVPAKKPDLDNLVKQLLDAMTRCQFWTDDALVVQLTARKRYAWEPVPAWDHLGIPVRPPRWEVTVQPYLPETLHEFEHLK